MRTLRIPILRLLLLSLAFLPVTASAQHRSGENAALRLENNRLKKKVDSLTLELKRLKGDAFFVDWDELDGLESEPAAFNTLGGHGERLSQEDEELAAKIRLAAPFLIIPYRAVIREYVDFYSIRKRRVMKGILQRYDSYLPVFRRNFKRHGIPEDIMALCIVESAVSPRALSKAGAYGMWQFMPDTARDCGLVVDELTDERTDVEKSTAAAAIYLARLYKRYGNWALAVSAYNCGPGTVDKAIILSGRKTDYWSVYDFLPDETKGYLPSLLAVRYVIANAEQLGIR